MNLLNNFKITTIFSTTSGNLGTTGVAVAVSTAGSSGGDSTTKGGFPFPSTGLDMAGYDGVVFVAQAAGSSAGINALFASYHADTSTALSTTFTEYPKAHAKSASASTVYDTIALDVVKPVYRFINATMQLAATSEVPISIVAIQYRGSKAPITST
ncbi:MAG: hypothetical protein NUW01_19255, partial [Gemmatimonadaceae bacterium]|nr:hypothetical protein [Gemmatimonadaceae bacterium]